MSAGPVMLRGERWPRSLRRQRATLLACSRRYGPKPAAHPSLGMPCLACGQPLGEGELTVLVSLGPGADPERRARARQGRWFTGVALEVHWACATGEEGE